MSDGLRVVHVITGLGIGGAEGVLYRLSKASGYECSVVTLRDGGGYADQLSRLGVKVTSVGMNSWLSVAPAALRLRKILKKEAPDVVQTWMYHADLLGGVVAKSLRIPVVWGIRNGSQVLRSSTRMVAWLCGILSPYVPTSIVSCSRRAIPLHEAMGFRGRFEWIPNGYSPPGSELLHGTRRVALRRDLGISPEALVFIHAGRADPQKDHPNLARAYSAAFEQLPKLKLVLCGDGLTADSDYFNALPFSDEARKSVIALGVRSDLDQLWAVSDFSVISSASEGFPNVVAEAMSFGVPCIVTDVGDASEIVGETGVIVPARDSRSLARAMVAAASMPSARRRELGLLARKRVIDNFSLDEMVRRFEDVWMKACSGVRYSRIQRLTGS